MITILLIIGLALLWIVAYWQLSSRYWFSGLATWLTLLAIHPAVHWLPALLSVSTAVVVLWLTWHDSARQQLLVKPLLKQFRRVLPRMSETEQIALDAGETWWEGELFSGRPDWNQLLDYPVKPLTAAEQAYLDGPVQQLCEQLDDWRITHELQDLPASVWQLIRRERLFGMIIPESYGGLGFSARAHSDVVMKIASRSITAAVTVMVPNSLGPAKLLLHYGTPAQRDHYLPRLARGDEIPCFALTSPVAGSDAGSLEDTGVVCHQQYKGKRTLGIRLNFNKRYITLAPVATLIGLACKLQDPEHLLGENAEPGITLVLIPSDTPGVETGKRHLPMNIPFQNGPVRGRDVFLPIDHIIGGPQQAGQGWRMLVECLSEGRGISLPALATSAGKLAARYTGAYARVRQQFNLPVGHFEGVKQALAEIAGLTYQMDAARKLTLAALDQGLNPSVISAIVKYHLTERYRLAINHAMDVQGGSGICLGPANPLGRVYQAIPISITVEGANILTRSMIIFGQGAIRAHPWVLQEMQAARDADISKAIENFDHSIFSHLSYLMANWARSFFLGLTRARLTMCRADFFRHREHQPPVSGFAKPWLKQLNWMAAAFALSADVAMMTLGGSLKRKEHLSARLGDMLSDLYLASAVIKQFTSRGSPREEQPLLQYSMEQLLYHLQQTLTALCRNLPGRWLGRLLRFFIFPRGLPYTAPPDHRVNQVADLLLSPSSMRDRLTSGIYTSQDNTQRYGLMENAFRLAETTAPIEAVLREARRKGLINGHNLEELANQALQANLISADDHRNLQQMRQLRDQVIQVDAFDLQGAVEQQTAWSENDNSPFSSAV